MYNFCDHILYTRTREIDSIGYYDSRASRSPHSDAGTREIARARCPVAKDPETESNICFTPGAPSIFLRTPPSDVFSEQEPEAVCPNLSLRIECTGTDVNYLEWQVNGEEIAPDFNIGDSSRLGESRISGPYTLILLAIDVDQTRRVANMTVQLVVNISSLVSGDVITCATLERNSSKTLNYMLRGDVPFHNKACLP